MDLTYRSFSGKTFRPQPEILIDDGLKFFAILTPWGPQFQTKNMLDSLFQNYKTLFSDQEMTFATSRLKCLSPEENLLRNAVLNFNHKIYADLNSETEHLFGYELICGIFHENKILFIQVGHPYIYLDRPQIPLQPIGHVLDLSGGFSQIPENLPPLPSQLLGIHPDMHFSVFTIPIKEQDRFLFISRTLIPAQIPQIPREKRTLKDITLTLSEDQPNMPFWIGFLNH